MENQVEYSIVINTCPDEAVSRSLATQLVEQGLAACVNIVPQVTSIYQWQGKLEQGSECILLIKTKKQCVSALIEKIAAFHPYELPEIIEVPITSGLPQYLAWISSHIDQTRVRDR